MKKIFLTMVMCLSVAVGAFGQNELKKVYDESVNPLEQIDNALAKAQKEGKFVVCQVGGNWCPWCLRFAAFVDADEEIAQLVDSNFVLIHTNYNPRKSGDAAQAEQAAALMVRLNNPRRFGFPVFVVLNDKGEVIHTQDSSFLEEGKSYDKEKVVRFFKNWTPGAVAQQ